MKVEAPKVVPPTLAQACERVATFLAVWPHEHVNPWPEDQRGLVMRWVQRSDLVALVAACGWNLTVEQARDNTDPFEQEALL